MIRAKLDHDLRSNLNVVLGYSAMLKEEICDGTDGDTTRDLDSIAAAGRELLHLNNQVEDLNQLYAGQWNTSTTKIALEDLIGQAQMALTERYPTHELKLTGEASLEGIDHTAIERIFDALVSGLCKYTPHGATISSQVNGSQAGTIRVDINCDPHVQEAGDKKRLNEHLQRLVEPVLQMSDIKDFEPYYLTTLCHHAKIKVCKVPDQLAFCMELFPVCCSTAVNKNVILS